MSRSICWLHAPSDRGWAAAGDKGIIHLAVRFRDYFPAPSEYQTGAGSEGCESCGGVNRNIMGGTSVSFCPLLLLLLAII